MPPAYCTQSVIKLLIVNCYGKQNNLEPFLIPLIQSWVVCCFLKVALTPTQHRLVRMGGGSGMKSALFPFWRRLFQDSRESASIKVARKLRGSWGELERASIVFNTSFRYTSSWYTLWLVNLTVDVNPVNRDFRLVSHTQRQRKNSERVIPSFTAHFDILTFVNLKRGMVFLEVGGVVGGQRDL